MRISAERIEELKHLLKKHYNLDYEDEQAQEAGRAILRLVGLKMHQQSKEVIYDHAPKRVRQIHKE